MQEEGGIVSPPCSLIVCVWVGWGRKREPGGSWLILSKPSRSPGSAQGQAVQAEGPEALPWALPPSHLGTHTLGAPEAWQCHPLPGTHPMALPRSWTTVQWHLNSGAEGCGLLCSPTRTSPHPHHGVPSLPSIFRTGARYPTSPPPLSSSPLPELSPQTRSGKRQTQVIIQMTRFWDTSTEDPGVAQLPAPS